VIRAAKTRDQAAAPRAIGTVKHFAPQQTIFAEGDPAAHFMLVIHGLVRSCSTFSDGRRFIGAFHSGGDIFGLERNPTYLASAEAVCETAVVLYPAPDWLDAACAPDALSRQIFGAMMLSTDQARGHARLLGRLRAIEKLSVFLLECHARSSQTVITLEMGRQDIADYLGLTVETVSRCLAQMKRQGLIGFRSARQFDLLDVKTLRAMSA
jgi:CRP/FNR family nitrogen fixation transcriptional regulator